MSFISDNIFQDLDDEEKLEHYGVKGMKWGVRRYQNPDGTRTELGKARLRGERAVFISGSSKTQTEDSPYYRKNIPDDIQQTLHRYMDDNVKIIVGDAPGIDRQVQDFFNEHGYSNIEVYGPGTEVRYVANKNWKTNPIDAPEFEVGSKEWLAKKDIAMERASTEGLAIVLDEGAKATRKNVERLLANGKTVQVYELNQYGQDQDKWLKHDDIYEDFIMHYGTPRHSGRYPWGSGEHPYQRYGDFYSQVGRLRAEGKKDKEIAEELGCLDRFGNPSTTVLKARYSNAKAEVRAFNQAAAQKYLEEGYSKSEIGRMMGVNESTVRSWLDAEKAVRNDLNRQTADVLKDYVDKYRYVDIGPGTEIGLGVTDNRLKNAIARLEEDGYKKQFVQVDQMGTNHKTTITVLTPPDVEYSELHDNRYDIRAIGEAGKVLSPQGDITSLGYVEPTSIDSSRIQINYAEDGGKDRDGLIELRRGVDDISLGGSRYAQVRIAVDGTHYLKGMAMYSDDLPPGIDIRFNTNKHKDLPLEDVLKPMKTDSKGNIDIENPFGATFTQKYYDAPDGTKKLSAINVVHEEGEWQTWSKSLPSQFLSKQSVKMAERQLTQAFQDKRVEFDEIKALTNPIVKKNLLISYADKCDSLASELKAAPFAGQQSHVLLPFKQLKDTEIYAPNYPDGTRVALIRYPHGGVFEIPELTVRNSGSPVKKILGNAPDAVGINSHVAERLSGADFDGDTVTVIPLSDKVRVKSKPPLEALKDFDPKEQYHGYPGMKVIASQTKQTEMGKVTNLITDMTLKGADYDEIARAVKHSMVIIDSEKHKLDYKRSFIENGIESLKKKYQDDGSGHTGSGTIISRASSEVDVPVRKDWRPSSKTIAPDGSVILENKTRDATYMVGKLKGVTKKNGGEVGLYPDKTKDGALFYLKKDEATGKKVRVYVTDDDLTWVKEKNRTQKATRMSLVDDAFKLTSGGSKENPGYPMEKVYATFANQMKSLANQARKEWLNTEDTQYNPEAAKLYKAEVQSLNEKLLKAKSNAPKERQAQLMANQTMDRRKAENPDMDKEAIKKYRGQAINASRNKYDAHKYKIEISDNEWKAIQAGAVTKTKLDTILNNADMDVLREKATPRAKKTVTPAMTSLAKSMDRAGYTNKDIADRLGLSVSAVYNMLK